MILLKAVDSPVLPFNRFNWSSLAVFSVQIADQKFKCTSPQTWQKPEGVDSGIQIFNCVTGKLVPLILRNSSFSTWYTCGPTVYASSHIGHASCYVKLDIIQRILRNYFNINLLTAMNITDIDDKIIKRSNEDKINWQEISKRYENEFWYDLKKLKIVAPDIKLRVTENIPLIIKYIETIYEKNLAYVGRDNSVYFKIRSCSSYGKLQRLNLEEEQHSFKECVADFALWKCDKDAKEPSWDSAWGRGRPGWHIECSSLASKIFGSNLDFHAGGLDLKFPHHENEEAQSCAYHDNSQWVNYWIHTGQLKLKGQSNKMSKSVKNTISVSEMLEKYTSNEFRMACILSNYRNSMEFDDEMMQTAISVLNKLISFNLNCQAYIDGKKENVDLNNEVISQKLKETISSIDNSLRNDFNTAKSISHLLDLAHYINKSINNNNMKGSLIPASNIDVILASKKFSDRILSVFGINFETKPEMESNSNINISRLIDEIVSIRAKLRKLGVSTKDNVYFRACDDIRSELKNAGIEIKDHDNNSCWTFSKCIKG